jgi:Sec-independent protein translocase protein TatA
MGEITVVLLLLLIFVGPSKLPELAAGLGKLIREFRKVTSDVKNEIVLDDAIRKPFEELRDAVTLDPEELKRRDNLRRAVEEAARKRREEEEAAKAATTAAMTLAPGESMSLPAGDAAAAVVTAPAAEGGDVSPIVPPVGPPSGTVARNRPDPAPVATALPVPGAARVTPPISSVEGERANVTQSLSEKDLLAGTPPPAVAPRRPTPPPLPGVSRKPVPGPNATQVLADKDLLPPGAPPAPGAKPPPVPGAKKS